VGGGSGDAPEKMERALTLTPARADRASRLCVCHSTGNPTGQSEEVGEVGREIVVGEAAEVVVHGDALGEGLVDGQREAAAQLGLTEIRSRARRFSESMA
jgi:hypothetical protein